MKIGVTEGLNDTYEENGELIFKDNEDCFLKENMVCYGIKIQKEKNSEFYFGEGTLYITDRRFVFISLKNVDIEPDIEDDIKKKFAYPFIFFDIKNLESVKKKMLNTIIEFKEDNKSYEFITEKKFFNKIYNAVKIISDNNSR